MEDSGVRIVVVEGARPVYGGSGFGSTPSGTSGFGGRSGGFGGEGGFGGVTRDARPHLGDLVTAAAAQISEPVEILGPDTTPDTVVDALMWDAEAMTQGAVPASWRTSPNIPAAYVVIFMREIETRSLLPLPLDAPIPTLLSVSGLHYDEAVATIAAWLEGAVLGVTQEHRQMLEVLINAVEYLLDDETFRRNHSPDDVAQAKAACDTIAAHLRAPRPSRRVLRWAVGQLNQFPAGFLSGLALEYLPNLMRHL